MHRLHPIGNKDFGRRDMPRRHRPRFPKTAKSTFQKRQKYSSPCRKFFPKSLHCIGCLVACCAVRCAFPTELNKPARAARNKQKLWPSARRALKTAFLSPPRAPEPPRRQRRGGPGAPWPSRVGPGPPIQTAPLPPRPAQAGRKKQKYCVASHGERSKLPEHCASVPSVGRRDFLRERKCFSSHKTQVLSGAERFLV